MKLSNKTLTKFIKGAVCFSEEKGYLCSYRYSRAQMDHMSLDGYDHCWRSWALHSSNIRIEFKTDAQSLSFNYRSSDVLDTNNTIDLYINDVLYSVYNIEQNLKGSVAFSMPAGEKKVSIYLPCVSKLDIKGFTIDGSYKTIKDKGARVLVIGDSITQGGGPSITSASYLNSLVRKTGYTVLGQGIAGYRYEPRDLMKVDGFEPDKIIVFIGTNYYDEKSCLDNGYDYEIAVNEFYEKLTRLYPETPIMTITPLWRNNNVDWERFLWCIDTIKKACEKYKNIHVVDGFTLVPNVDECYKDKIHPNSYGSELLASNILKNIKELKF